MSDDAFRVSPAVPSGRTPSPDPEAPLAGQSPSEVAGDPRLGFDAEPPALATANGTRTSPASRDTSGRLTALAKRIGRSVRLVGRMAKQASCRAASQLARLALPAWGRLGRLGSRARRWLTRPWRIEAARHPVDLCLVACSAILPAGVVYLEFLGRHAPAWLGRLAGLIAGLWVASLLLRAAELIRVLLVLKRQARALQRAAQTLTLTPSLPPGPRKGLFTGIRYALDAARANEPIRALLLSGSALAFSYFPAIVAFVGVVPGHTAALSTSRPPHSVFVLLVIGLGLFLTSAFMAGAILHPRTRVRALRQAVHDAAYGRSSSEFREELEIGCEIAKNGMRDTGWHERKTTNVGAEPLWWRTLGIGTSDVPAYRYRRFVTPRVNVRGGGPGPSQRIYLVPIGRPFDEGTNPLLEYAAIFDPPIPEGGVISWRVDFDWPEFSSKFRHDDQDMYQATFASWTTRVDFVVWAPCPIDARFDQADSEGTTVEGAGTPRTRCIQRFVAAAPASTRRMFRVKYARAS